jgi:hypothetical protein
MKTLKMSSVSLVLLVAVSLSSAFADQPHMQAALAQLRTARAELQKATADKAGHRQRAITLVDQTIAEVEQGEAAARPARR